MKNVRIATLFLVTVTLVFLSPTLAQGELVFASWGGTYQDAIREAWLNPFSEETGITIIEDTSPEIAKIRAMVETNTVSWDVVTGGGATLAQGVNADLFEAIPNSAVNRDHHYPDAISEYGVASEVFSTLFGFDTRVFPADSPQPQSWVDFWDVEQFPGMRSFYGRPNTSLEIALLADGVPAEDVYDVLSNEEGLDRAFAKLEKLRPNVAVWWTSGEVPVQVLGSGEVVMATAYNGRFQGGIDEGVPIQMVWNGAIAQLGYFMIPKGAPNMENALRFLDYIASPEAQARFHEYVAYGPVTADAWEFIPESQWDKLPSSPQNIATSLWLDYDFWLANEAKIMERWQAFLQQ